MIKVKRQSISAVAIALLLSTTVSCIYAAPARQEARLLLPQARFERPSIMEAWRGGEPWMRDAYRVEKEDGLSFLRTTQSNAYITTNVVVPQHTKELALGARVRLTDYEAGAQAWDVAGLTVTFYDRFGNVISNGWDAGIRFDKGSAQWQPVGRRYLVPQDAQFAKVEIFQKGKKGTFDVANLQLFNPAQPPVGVDVAALGAAINVATPLDAKAKTDGAPILDPKRGIGSKVDEKAVKVTLHVAANAKVGGDGSKAKPFNSPTAAVEAARPLLNQGQGVRIAVQAGLYRLTQEKTVIPQYGHSAAIDLANWTPQGRDAVLVIEGVGGQAVLSGAEASSPQEWKLVNADKRIYSRPWKENFGFQHAGYYVWKDVNLHRRELIALNGKRLNPVLLEEYTWQDPKMRVYDNIGNIEREVGDTGKEPYTYVGWKGIDILEPGQFGVAERDDHPGGDTIYMRLPAGMKSLDGATIDIGKARSLMMPVGKNNLVIRNLTFQHTASHYAYHFNTSAFETGGWIQPNDTHDWLIENCIFRENNGRGLVASNVNYVDLRNVRSENNGGMGMTVDGGRMQRFANVEVLNNNWRAQPSGNDGHGGGGFTFAGEDATFTDCKFNGNWGFGFREDVMGTRIVHERCQFNNNREGIFYEISWGPILFKDCQINNNEKRGLFLLNVRDVTVDNTDIKDNGVGVSIYNMPGRTTPLSIEASAWDTMGIPIQMVENFVLKNSRITSSKPEQKLFERLQNAGSLELYHLFLREEYTGTNNRFFNPASKEMFDLSPTWSPQVWEDFAAWLKASREDATSKWTATK